MLKKKSWWVYRAKFFWDSFSYISDVNDICQKYISYETEYQTDVRQ